MEQYTLTACKKNKKFLYQTIKEGARAREYESDLNWLNDANLIYKVYNLTKTDFPLKAYNDLSAFKIYINDIGLLRRMSNLDSRIVAEGDRLFEEFKGAFTENFVLNMCYVIYSIWFQIIIHLIGMRLILLFSIKIK